MQMAEEKRVRNVIQLSFKDNGNDKELYEHLRGLYNPSGFIKELLWSVYKNRPLMAFQGNSAVQAAVVLPNDSAQTIDLLDMERQYDVDL